MRPASARTVHRFQGDTLNEAVTDLPNSRKEHIHYVALSRVRSISGLHILNLHENKISVSEKVKKEMSRLRAEALLKPCIPFLYNTSDNKNQLSILFQNVRSLQLQIKDVTCDYNVQAAHVNIFVESTLRASDSSDLYNLENFEFFRNDYNPLSFARTPYGTVAYIQNDVVCLRNPFRYNYGSIEVTISVLDSPIENMHIIGNYRPKSKVTISH